MLLPLPSRRWRWRCCVPPCPALKADACPPYARSLNSSLNLLNKWSLGVFGFRFPLLLTSCECCTLWLGQGRDAAPMGSSALQRPR